MFLFFCILPMLIQLSHKVVIVVLSLISSFTWSLSMTLLYRLISNKQNPCVFYTFPFHVSKLLHAIMFSNLTKVPLNNPNATMSPFSPFLTLKLKILKAHFSFCREIDEEALEQALSAAVTCTILAAAGPQRSRVLATLYKVNTLLMNSSYILRNPLLCLSDVLWFGSG